MHVCGVNKVGYSQSNCYKSAPILSADKTSTAKINADVVSFAGKNVLPVTIRNARLADIPAILKLDKLCFPDYVLRHAPDQAKLEKSIVKDASTRAVAINRNGQIVGYIYVQKNFTGKLGQCIEGLYERRPNGYPFNSLVESALKGMRMLTKDLWLGTMAVHPEAQGQKVGQRLMLEVFNKAAQIKAGASGLGVEASNDAAQKLYRKFGFFNLKRMRDYYGEGKHIYLMGVDTTTAETIEKLASIRQELGLSNAK